MALSYQEAVSDGTLATLNVTVGYFDRADIHVLFDEVEDALPWAWVGATAATITFSPAVPVGVVVRVKRITSLAAPLHEFALGAAFTAESVDEQFLQSLYVAQEVQEGAIITDVFDDLDMHNHRVINVADATAPGDAVNYGQMLDEITAVTINLVLPADFGFIADSEINQQFDLGSI